MSVSFDLFGTLVAVERPADPAAAVGRALRERGVAVPADWSTAYREPHAEASPGAERSLVDHVAAALAARDVTAPRAAVDGAVRAAFDPETVEPRPGAAAALRAARRRGSVGVLSNCSVPGLVERVLARAPFDAVDAVVTSVGCGWRKPDRRAFAAVADRLGVGVEALVHVGDDPETDGGVERHGGTFLDCDPLATLPDRLEAVA